ncbi:MAG: transposase [Desulfovibrionaceae bacterium]
MSTNSTTSAAWRRVSIQNQVPGQGKKRGFCDFFYGGLRCLLARRRALDWQGILVSDGYGVYAKWMGPRQTCLAHLIRHAKGLAKRKNQAVAKCGAWTHKGLQRLCHMAKAPPTVGEWIMFYARFIRLVSKYSDRPDHPRQRSSARRLRPDC